MIINQLLEALFSREFGLNLLAEFIGVTLEATIVYLLLKRYFEHKEKRKWKGTRRAFGNRVGWKHAGLLDELLPSDSNAYVVIHGWVQEALAEIKAIKSEYAYAFDADISGKLEIYEYLLRQTAGGMEVDHHLDYRFENAYKGWFETLDKVAVEFLRSASVLENDILHLFQWGENAHHIRRRLLESDEMKGKEA